MGSIKGFEDLQASMAAASQAPPRAPPPPRESQNPRLAAKLTSAQWSAARKSRRRAEWTQRAQTHEAVVTSTKPVRDVAAFQSFEDAMAKRLRAESCLDPAVPLDIPVAHQRPERGQSVGGYFAAKWARCGGTLGEHEALCPFYEAIRKNGGLQ